MEGTNGGRRRRPRWYSGSSSHTTSSSSRTLSTSCKSHGSRLSSLCLEASMHFDYMEIHHSDEDVSGEGAAKEDHMSWIETETKDTEVVRPIKQPRKEIEMKQTGFSTAKEISFQKKEAIRAQQEKIKEIKILVQEFFSAPSAANCSITVTGGNISVLDWWLKHLGVGWVLHVTDDQSAGLQKHTFDHASWIRALTKITETISCMASLCPDQPETEVRTESGNGASIVDQFQYAQFIQGTMLKLLAFVDVIAASDAKQITLEERDLRNWMVPRQQYNHLNILLSVHSALSNALYEIRLSFSSPSSAQVERIHGEIVSLLSSKEAKVAEAIWSTMQQIRAESIEDDNGSLTSLNPQESSDIHKTTQAVVTYIRFLQYHSLHVAAIVSEANRLGKYVPQIGNLQPLNSMIIEMVSRVQEKLANISESYSDQCLRFLFLLNNSYLIIKQKLHCESDSSLQVHVAALVTKVEMYMESYLQLSWDPVLSCLLNPTPVCYGRSSPLTKFESAFQKTYTRQKLWKVPDPELRKRLRKAITNKVIYGYTKYIEDNNVTTPKFTSQELEEMLQELFEG